ncbi:MAG: efflux RND transporter periplasmic adaptor subunit [Planctomycetota bacterium]
MGRGRVEERRGGVLLVLLIACVAAFGVWRFDLLEGLIGEPEEVAIEGAPVRRGDLRISELVRGNMEATDRIELKSEIEGRSTIIYLAEEGTALEAGDLVAELDVSQLEDDLVRQEIEVKNAEAAFTKAREQYDIQVIQNESDLALAELALELARLDLAKYTGLHPDPEEDPEDGEEEVAGEWDNELLKAEENVLLREEDLAAAQKELDWSKKLLDGGFVQKNEYEGNVLAEQRASIQLGQARRDLDLLVTFGNRRRLAELRADVDTKIRDVTKTEKQAMARLADYEAARESARYKLDRERQQLEELRGQVGKSKIYAPEPGLLVYARERSRWGSGDTIEEGDEVRERQEIATIPRAGGMTVRASIHETKLKKITTGLPCVITVDAFQGRTFEGRVDFVAVVADSGSWRSNPNQRLYKADISLLEPTREMRPGMSCSVEILVKDLSDTLYVPRQCVFLDGGQPIVFVSENGQSSRREVEVGLDNTKWVSISSGVEEGDIVLLAPPPDFEPAPAPEPEMAPGAFQGAGPKAPAGAGGAGGGSRGGSREGSMARGGREGGRESGRPGGAGGKRPDASQFTEAQRAEWMNKMRERKASGGGGGSTRGEAGQ